MHTSSRNVLRSADRSGAEAAAAAVGGASSLAGALPVVVAPGDTSNICEPLRSSDVCQKLNDSDALCQPSRWAGEAIQEAINATRAAMRALQQALRSGQQV